MSRDDIIAKLKTAKSQHLKYGITIIGLFGSFAKNKNDDFSDIDIAYSIDHTLFSQYFSDGFSKLLKIEEIKEQLEKVFHKKIDFISLNSNNKNLITNIKKDLIYV